jgi:hypothetical protein
MIHIYIYIYNNNNKLLNYYPGAKFLILATQLDASGFATLACLRHLGGYLALDAIDRQLRSFAASQKASPRPPLLNLGGFAPIAIGR